jgi:hypothetical protein
MTFSRENQPAIRFLEAIPEGRRCEKIARSGKQCKNARYGTFHVCFQHGGATLARHPAVLAGREVKRIVTRRIREQGAQELWQVEAFKRSHSKGKLRLLDAWLESVGFNDPGILRRAIDAEERELQKWQADH